MRSLIWRLVLLTGFLFVQAVQAQEEVDAETPYLDFWENWLPPEAYAKELSYVQNAMKDESQIEHLSKRGLQLFSTPRWVSIGPSAVKVLNADRSVSTEIVFHGRVRVLHWYHDPTLGWQLYLGASSGGLWVGNVTLFGRVWTSLGDNLPNPSVGAFVVKPGDPNTIFVGTGDFSRFAGAGLLKTTNRGASWARMPLLTPGGEIIPYAITDIFYDPTDSSVMWLSSTSGVFRSTNAGSIWNQVAVDPASPSSGVFDMVINPSNPGILYAGLAYSKGVWRTTNGGTSWTHLTTGLPASNLGWTCAIDISLSNSQILYTAFSDSLNNMRGIYWTANGGNSWFPVPSTPPTYMSGGQGAHTNVIKVHPTNPGIVYAGSVQFIRSTDGGITWSTLNGSGTDLQRGHDDLEALEFDPLDPDNMVIGSDGGIFRFNAATNIARNSDEIFTPGAIIQSYSLDYAASRTSEMLSGTQDNGTLLTQQGGTEGASWTMISGCDGGNHVNIDPLNSAQLFYNSWCGKHHPRLRSLDRGVTIDNINGTLADTNLYYTPISLCKKIANMLFTLTPTTLYYSTDLGTNWLPAHDVSQNLDPGEGIRGMAAGGYGATIVCYVWFWGDPSKIKVAHGVPGAMTWSVRNLPGSATIGQSNFANSGVRADRLYPYTAYAFENSPPYRMYKTTNTGISWTDITGTDPGGTLPNARKYEIASSPSDPAVMYAATDFGVFKTTNNGATWYKFQFGLPTVPVTDVVLIPGTSGDPDTLRAGTFGRGYWQRILNGDDPLFVGFHLGSTLHGLDLVGTYGLSVGDGSTIAHTSDGGKSWVEGTAGTTGSLNASRLLDSLTGIAVGVAGTIVRTTDGGGSWSTVPSPVQASFFDVFFNNHLNGTAVGDAGTIIHSSDGGQSWQTIATGIDAHYHSVFFSDQLNGWISGTDNSSQTPMVQVLRTTDGGMNWSPLQSVGPGGGCDVAFPDPLNGYLTTEGGGIFKTTDGGQSWLLLQSGTQESLHSLFFLNPDVGWACGDGGTLLHTIDGGMQWMPEESGTDSTLNAVALGGGNLITAGVEGIFSRATTTPAEVIRTINGGWNMVSVALQLSNNMKSFAYPSASSDAFAYTGSYTVRDTLNPGNGYWLKFASDGSLGQIGAPISNLTFSVGNSWNMIGSISQPVPVSSIVTNPPGIIVSPFYGYAGGYTIADSIDPGYGYWVKTSQNGLLTLTSSVAPPSKTLPYTRASLQPYNVLTISDNARREQKLYFSATRIPEDILNRFVLPPLPPDGGFDVRFSSGRLVEAAGAEVERSVPILVRTDHYPVRLSWEINIGLAIPSLMIGPKRVPMHGTGNAIVQSSEQPVSLQFASGSSASLPHEYALTQNYPNPFNPTTMFRYQLPAQSHVRLDVFNLLGQNVAVLVNEVQQAGVRELSWDASGLPSGVYYYRLTAGHFVEVKKLSLVK